MNRLIIVGNGFDLSHGLPTKYSDFLAWYLKKAFTKAREDNSYSDHLLKIISNNTIPVCYSTCFKTIPEMVDFYIKNFGIKPLLIPSNGLLENTILKFYKNPFNIDSGRISPLLKSIIDDFDKLGWVDVEMAYHRHLSKVLFPRYAESRSTTKQRLVEINSHLKFISDQLSEYLKTIKKAEFIRKIWKNIYSEIDPNDFIINKKSSLEKPIDLERHQNIAFLNFNYTSTVELYTNPFSINQSRFTEKPYVINIHGQIDHEKTLPIVFGFGDELDENYQKMENSNIKGFFDHAKSFSYFQNKNYSDLVRFIESGDFQVFIFGHSCGQSDRTLLNMIFEHDYCQSIKIFYHQFDDGSNTYRDTTEEISRHFRDKVKMRNRVVNFELCKALLE